MILKQNNTYYFEIFNIDDIVEEITIGYSYFVDISEIKNYEEIYISKPIIDLEYLYETRVEYYNSSPSQYQEKEVNNTNKNNYEFEIEIDTIDFTERMGYIQNLQIFIQELDSELDEINDKFVLRLYKDQLREEHMYSIYMSYEYDAEEENYCLKYTNYNQEFSIFSYANVEEQNKYYCTLQIQNKMNAKRSIYILYDASEYSDNEAKNYKINVKLISKFFLTSPGMLNLASQNYIIMRCDEIENHVRGSYDVKDYSPGLGVLNIDVQGYAAGRTDFYSIVYKEFHPIGRLNKLKFRFERKSDGKLYDFKNIDLHFLIAIKFLRQIQKQ